jgi:hypothetical protein
VVRHLGGVAYHACVHAATPIHGVPGRRVQRSGQFGRVDEPVYDLLRKSG